MAITIGIIIGLVLGLTGSGGSILAVPLLVVFLQLEPLSAIGLSLGVVAASAMVGVAGNIRSCNIQWLPALVFSIIGSSFTPLGHFISKRLDPIAIIFYFSLLVIIVAILMWRKSTQAPETTHLVRADAYQYLHLCRRNNQQPFKLGLAGITSIGIAAIFTGTLSGLFGVGGGFIIVPSLILLLKISMQQAVATSLVIISLVSSAGFINYARSQPTIDFSLLIEIILGSIIGMQIGLFLTKYISGPILQKIFVLIMLLMAAVMLSKNIIHSI